MNPGKYDLRLYRGDFEAWRCQLWQDTARTVAVDLAAATAAAEFRDKPGGTTVVAFDCTITQPNIIDIQMTADLWAGAPAGGVWDLEVTFPDGPTTVLAGKVTVTPDVTNSVAIALEES